MNDFNKGQSCKPYLTWLNMPHWSDCIKKKNKFSKFCVVFKNLRDTVLAIWSIGTF